MFGGAFDAIDPAKLGGALAGLGGAAGGTKSSVEGSFSVFQAMNLGGGNSAADRTAKATENTAKATKKVVEAVKANTDGRVFT